MVFLDILSLPFLCECSDAYSLCLFFPLFHKPFPSYALCPHYVAVGVGLYFVACSRGGSSRQVMTCDKPSSIYYMCERKPMPMV